MKTKKESQNDKILAYIKRHGEITPMEALKHCGSMRLSARIWDLRHKGYAIRTDTQAVYTKDGSKAMVAVYSLEDE